MRITHFFRWLFGIKAQSSYRGNYDAITFQRNAVSSEVCFTDAHWKQRHEEEGRTNHLRRAVWETKRLMLLKDAYPAATKEQAAAFNNARRMAVKQFHINWDEVMRETV